MYLYIVVEAKNLGIILDSFCLIPMSCPVANLFGWCKKCSNSRNFISLFEPHWWHWQEARPQALENDSFTIYFMYLELRREHKGDYMNVGEREAGKSLWLDYWRVNKIMCSLKGGYVSQGSERRRFKGVLTQMHKNNGQGLIRPINLLLRKF